MTEVDVTRLARTLGARCKRRRIVVATAESCTGGGVATAITRISGSATWFDRGFVTYSNEAKSEMLGVPAALIAAHGAVSAEVACAMAEGALVRSRAAFSVAVTGVAGPGGGSPAKPVGTVWIAVAASGEKGVPELLRASGDRSAIRQASVVRALELLLVRCARS